MKTTNITLEIPADYWSALKKQANELGIAPEQLFIEHCRDYFLPTKQPKLKN